MSNQRPKYDFWKNLAKERCLREPFDAAEEGEGATKIVFSKNTPGIDWFVRRSPAMQNIVRRCEQPLTTLYDRQCSQIIARMFCWVYLYCLNCKRECLDVWVVCAQQRNGFHVLRYFLRESFDRCRGWGRLSKGANSERRPEWREKRKTPFPEMDLSEQEKNHWKSVNLGQNEVVQIFFKC